MAVPLANCEHFSMNGCPPRVSTAVWFTGILCDPSATQLTRRLIPPGRHSNSNDPSWNLLPEEDSMLMKYKHKTVGL